VIFSVVAALLNKKYTLSAIADTIPPPSI